MRLLNLSGQHHERVREVWPKKSLPGLDDRRLWLDPISVERLKSGSSEQLPQRGRVLPAHMFFVHRGLSVAPDFPGASSIKGIWRGDDDHAAGNQVLVHV